MAGSISRGGRLLLETTGSEDTIALGRALATMLAPGDVVALAGPLGSGKTYLVKGMVGGLGVTDSRYVRSPSFIIISQYPCPARGENCRVNHVDAYRLKGPEELRQLGTEELFSEDNITLVEWADKVMEVLPEEKLVIRLSHHGEHTRRFELEGWENRLGSLPGSLLNRWVISSPQHRQPCPDAEIC